MNRLKEINDEIYRRWKAGENHVDLAREYGRWSLESLLRNRAMAEERANNPPQRGGPTNKEQKKIYGPRNETIAKRHEAGETFTVIARDYGICRERARQIWMRHLRRIGDRRGFYGPRLAARLSMNVSDEEYARDEEDAQRKRDAKEGFDET